MNARKVVESRDQLKREWKKEEQKKVDLGKKPYFMKKSDFKVKELTQKYQHMTAHGQDIDKLLEKKRKRTASKQQTRIPKTRRSAL